MTLGVEIDPSPSSDPASTLDTVWLHGFTQTARSWLPLLNEPRLHRSAGRRVRIDLPGHGASPPASGDLWQSASDIVDCALACAVSRAVLVGYSLGGRSALHVALTRPDMWRGVVLIGATPGLVDPTARRNRRAVDEILADRIEMLGVDAFLDEWLAQPLFARLSLTPDQLSDRRRNTAPGLASSLRHHGTGTQDDLRRRLNELTMPALIMAGALDTKFVAAAHELAELWGGEASVVEVPESGHAAHLERSDLAAAFIASWFAQFN